MRWTGLGVVVVTACFREGDVDGSTSTIAVGESSSGERSTSTSGDPSAGPTSGSTADVGADTSSSESGTTTTSDGGDPSSSSDGSTDTGVVDECHACLMGQVAFCGCEGDCAALGECLYDGGELGYCCTAGPRGYSGPWNAFVQCALGEGCQNTCGADPPDCI